MYFPRCAGPNAGIEAMTQRATFQRVGIDAAAELLRRDDVIVLDVRDAASYEKAHIGAARWVSEGNLHEVLRGTPKDKPVLIYCYHGNASQAYARIFNDFGFADVYSLDGGFELWSQAQAGVGRSAP
jgi:thiosulfate/3-mercaptopyruvate sulfurtransferase